MFRHADELARRGHDVVVRVQEGEPVLSWLRIGVPFFRFDADDLTRLPSADLCIFDRTRLGEMLFQAGIGQVVHLCQGFEGTDAELRLRAARSGIGRILRFREAWRQQRRLRAVERAYRLPVPKIVTHRHLKQLIADRFGQSAYFVPYGLPPGLFRPSERPALEPFTILVVGPTRIGWKRIGDALVVVKRLKELRPELRLVRVSQDPMGDAERALGVTDEYHTMLSAAAMAEVYRRADLFLTTSNETEGFGLPLLEALASGLPAVATDIPAFRTFDAQPDYAALAPVGDISGLTAAVLRLLDNLGERRRLAARGLQVAAAYTMARSFAAMEAAVTEIAAMGRRQAA
jgi:glycosyltransferase involved in cell wall biosynthesis